MSDRKRPRVHPRTHTKNSSYTVQESFAEAANINTVIGRHMKGPGRMGIPLGNPNATRQGRFMDVSSESFHEMLNKVTDAQTAFMGLPARTRGRFNNDPYQLLRFLEKPENRAEAERLGLVEPRPPSEGHLDPQNLDEEAPKADDEANPDFKKKGGK